MALPAKIIGDALIDIDFYISESGKGGYGTKAKYQTASGEVKYAALKQVQGYSKAMTDLGGGGVARQIHLELLKAHRDFYKRQPIGPMNNLGPSVINPDHPQHVWRFKDNKFVFGTRVPYKAKYEKNTGNKVFLGWADLADRIKGVAVRGLLRQALGVFNAQNAELATYVLKGGSGGLV